MSDKSKVTLKWPLIDGILQKSDTTYVGPENNQATYIHEVYKRPDGQNTEVTKGIYSDGYRFIDMITGDNTFTQGYRPDGSINYTILPEEYKKWQKQQVPKGFTGMQIKRALNILNPLTWPSRIAATLPKSAPEGTKFPAIVVDKKSQTLRYYDKNGEQQLSSIVSTGANKGDITAQAESKTPEGHFTIGSKVDNVKEGVFGDNLFMGLSGTSNSGFKVNGRGFGIHGDANRPLQLGRCDSHGCVRVENKNLDELYNLVQSETNVYIRKKGGNMKLIPKGAKGWYASEMQTWSPEKMKQILDQYGKEGLSAATYAYLHKHVYPTTVKTNTNTVSNADIKLLQKALGFTGKSVDGLYGADTIKEMKKKYGTTDLHQVLATLKTQPVNTQTSTNQNDASDDNSSFLFNVGTKSGYIYNPQNLNTQPEKPQTEKPKEQQKGVDYRGQKSWTQTRVDANIQNSINDEYETPVFAGHKDYVKVKPREFSMEDANLLNAVDEYPLTEYGILDVNKQHDLQNAAHDEEYGKGNWYRDASGKIVTRKTAPNIGYSAFTIPQEWNDFINNNQAKLGSGNERLSDNAFASLIFGDDSGFHTGTWLFGSTGRVPMYLSKEESLNDAYAKAYAAGNRRFTYNGKTYTTTSYTQASKDYLQALYDAEFEKGKTGTVSKETQKRLDELKTVWANDEMQRFGIDARTLGGTPSSGYPVATNYNVANNVGQFGYDHGARRMMLAANGYVDLGNNNQEVSGNTTWEKLTDSFSLPGVDRETKHSSPQRTALLKLGVSQALEPGSVELSKVSVNPTIQPTYMSGVPTNYAYTLDKITGFKPSGNWEKKSSGNYLREGTQINGTMWNASEIYDPNRDITYIYDVNDYGFGPNSSIGWGGYAGIPVVSMSKTQSKPKT